MLFEVTRRICQCWFRAGPRWTPAGSDADHEFVCCMSPPIFLSPYFLSALYSSCPVKAWKNAPKANYKRKAGLGPLTLFIWESWRLSCWCRRCDEMANKKILVNPSWNGSLFMGQFTRIQKFNRHIYLWIMYPADSDMFYFSSISLFSVKFNKISIAHRSLSSEYRCLNIVNLLRRPSPSRRRLSISLPTPWTRHQTLGVHAVHSLEPTLLCTNGRRQLPGETIMLTLGFGRWTMPPSIADGWQPSTGSNPWPSYHRDWKGSHQRAQLGGVSPQRCRRERVVVCDMWGRNMCGSSVCFPAGCCFSQLCCFYTLFS